MTATDRASQSIFRRLTIPSIAHVMRDVDAATRSSAFHRGRNLMPSNARGQ
jgi:hypothetical protein